MTFRKYLLLVGITVFGAVGDCMLSRGMREIGGISFGNLGEVILSILNPWVALGIVFLLVFFSSYMMALSWADLTYVLPATSMGYVLLALMARFFLHEHVTTLRWIGIFLIAAGVALVTRGPALTKPTDSREQPQNDSVAAGVGS